MLLTLGAALAGAFLAIACTLRAERDDIIVAIFAIGW